MRSLAKWIKRLNKSKKNKINWLNKGNWTYLGV